MRNPSIINFKKTFQNIVFLIVPFLFNNIVYSQTTDQITTPGSGTWTVPTGVTSITIQAWGGGGAGGASTVDKDGGSGGGGGAYSSKTIAVTPGDVISYTIGAGGTTTAGNGNPGGTTTVAHIPTSTNMSAGGGAGGTLNANPAGVGGTASGGTVNNNGSTGGNGGGNSGGAGGNAANTAGGGGTGGAGGGNNTAGSNGNIIGGGGGGGEQASGGTGARGQVNITYTIPKNDICANARALPCGTSNLSGTTVGATNVAHNTGCTMANYGAWYTFVGDGQQTTISTSPAFDIKLSIATGSCGSLTNIVCTDSSPETATFTTINGTTYYVYVSYWSSGGTTTGTFTISRTCAPAPVPPANNLCANATSLPCGTTSLPGTTVNTVNVAPNTGCSLSNYGVWYTFIGDGNPTTISSTAGSGFDHEMSISSGTCGSLTSITCQDSGFSGGTETYTFTTVNGTRYYVYIADYSTSGSTTGTFTITRSCVTCPPPTVTATTNITPTTATINWSAPSNIPSGGYQYVVSTSATPPASGTATTATTINVTGLTSDTVYYVHVRSNCGAGDFSTWSTGTFNTGYCVFSTSSSTYWISNFSTTGGNTLNITNNTTYSAGGYGNYTATGIVNQYAGINFNFSSTLSSGTHGVNIWVDWNRDYDFDDAGEKVYASSSYVSSASGSITIPAGTAAGDYRMRIVANYNSTNPSSCGSNTYTEAEDYTVRCIGPLPCAGNPSAILANVTSQTTATITWTAASPVPASGYQYYLATSATPVPVMSTAVTGAVASGTTLNLTGLTPNTTYYIWIRSNCGAPNGQGAWVGYTNFFMPNCTVGNSTGTSTLGCPSVVSGGLGLNGADPAPIGCTAASTCVNLEAKYLPLGSTTSYNVQSITYAPPYQFGCLKNPVSVNTDDKWSPVINLPFNFCFYGNTYNKCLIGSNGIVTFDTTTNTPGGTCNWSFNADSGTAANLPVAGHSALIPNAIFGVFHDINPAVGGEVGWELITLNSGCRALVVSWSKVPMYSSDTTNDYTGMMVLYENTNIIEVYINKKRITTYTNGSGGIWNNGNAVVGIQNATGTVATVAPGRNALDPDWTATNEAWRFVPSGTSITSLKWYQGSGTSGPVVGTTDTISVCPTTTTTYTAEVTYTLCNGTTLKEIEETTVTIDGKKTWTGVIDTDWNNDNNWTPIGKPTSVDCILIPNTVNKPIVSGTGYVANGYNITIDNGAILTINSDNNISIVDYVNVVSGGTFNIKNNASLLQTNNIANTGNINYERTTRLSRPLDYTYWNSPVTGFTTDNLTTALSYIFTYTPTIGGGPGNWVSVSAGSTMLPTKGYIARAPLGTPAGGALQTVNFIGVPNNGTINIPIAKGTNVGIPGTTAWGTPIVDSDDQWNLIGNPYPSAVDIRTFLDDVTNKTLVDGTIYLWTHNTLPSAATPDPFYGNFVYNYTASDYATLNYLGGVVTAAGSPMPSVNIGAGQSFFVVGLNNGNARFMNNMRVLNNNNNFFKTANNSDNALGATDERLWLNFSDNNGGFGQILVGYSANGSLDWDRGYDGENLASNAVKFYSIIPEKNLTIQARPLPFAQTDVVPLGYNATAAGNFTIGIDHIDASFQSRNVYLEDKLLNVIHNLKEAPYSFTSESGTFDNRFVLRYTENNLGNQNTEVLENSVLVFANEKLNVKSTLQPIREITVYDVLGRLLINEKKVNANEFTAVNLNKTNSGLVVKITLENNTVITKKVIY